jgi:hypothetical protein
VLPTNGQNGQPLHRLLQLLDLLTLLNILLLVAVDQALTLTLQVLAAAAVAF